jgi:hypothetical protein
VYENFDLDNLDTIKFSCPPDLVEQVLTESEYLALQSKDQSPGSQKQPEESKVIETYFDQKSSPAKVAEDRSIKYSEFVEVGLEEIELKFKEE